MTATTMINGGISIMSLSEGISRATRAPPTDPTKAAIAAGTAIEGVINRRFR